MVDDFSISEIPEDRRNGFEFTLPEGRYYIGDPCYVIPYIVWDGIMDSEFNESEGVFTSIAGEPMVSFGTAYGDGVYQDNEGNAYPVDAGLIGAIPETLVEDFVKSELKGSPKNMLPDDNFIDFDTEWRAFEKDGILHFGHIKVDTN